MTSRSDRWNSAIEAAAKACEEKAAAFDDDGYISEEIRKCKQAILALREAEDQRGAAAEAGLKTGGRLNAPDVDSVGGSVPSAKGSAAIAPSVEASQSAPHPDMVLVPREPTDRMLRAGQNELPEDRNTIGARKMMNRIYRAMLAAAEDARRG